MLTIQHLRNKVNVDLVNFVLVYLGLVPIGLQILETIHTKMDYVDKTEVIYQMATLLNHAIKNSLRFKSRIMPEIHLILGYNRLDIPRYFYIIHRFVVN